MTTYNVIDRNKMAPGAAEDITVVLANLDAIAAVLNGGIDNLNIAPVAQIARDKLNFGGGLVDADMAAGMALAISKLAGYPNDVTKALLGNGTWGSPGGAITNLQRNFVEKLVQNTTVETSVFNSSPVVTGGLMGLNGCLHIRVGGRIRQGTNQPNTWTWKLKLGGTTIWTASMQGGNATDSEGNWESEFFVQNLGVANSQLTYLRGNDNATQSRPPSSIPGFSQTSAIDTTVNQALDLTLKMTLAGANDYCGCTIHDVWVDAGGE